MVTTRSMLLRLVPGLSIILMAGTLWIGFAMPAHLYAAENATGSKLEDLLKERLAVARELLPRITEEYMAGNVLFPSVQQATRALIEAEFSLCKTNQERIAVLEKMLEQVKQVEKNVGLRFNADACSKSDVLMAKATHLEIEIALEQAKSPATAQPQ